jgi:hypothetical protein
MVDLNDRNTQIIIGAATLVVIIAGAWWFVARGANPKPGEVVATTTVMSSSPTTTVPSEALPGAPVAQASGESVTVQDQAAGESVQVASVRLSETSWIAVRDENGKTLGAALFPAGTQTDVSVPLLRATEAGQHYQALIYVDNGDHQFDLHADTLIVNADGTVAGTAFNTTK